MARELSIYGQRRIGLPAQLPVVQVSTTGIENLQRGSELLGRTAEQIAERAAQTAYTRAQVAVTRETSRIANEHASDPEALSSAMTEWSDEFTSNIFDTEVREKIRLQIETTAANAVAKATERRNETLKQEQQYNGLLALDTIQKEIEDIAPDVASGKPEAARKLQEIMARGLATANEVGPDGLPIFTPEQRARRVMAVQDGVPLAIARAYVANSGNTVAAANNWVKNGLTVTLMDENGQPQKINIRDAMSFEGREKADSQVMGLVRDQLAIQAAGRAAQERQAKALAEQAYTTMLTQMQDNPQALSVEQIDLNRSIFLSAGMSDEYLALRKQALGGEPIVENGSTVRLLQTYALNGNDVRQDAIRAYNDGAISSQTLNSIVSTVQSNLGERTGPVATERQQLLDFVGERNPVTGMAAKPDVAEAARRAFDAEVDAFKAQNNRPPTATEVQRISETLRRTYAPTRMSDLQRSAPPVIPSGMIKVNPAPEDVQKVERYLTNTFTGRYGADRMNWDNTDPDMIDAYNWLEQYKNATMQTTRPKLTQGQQ